MFGAPASGMDTTSAGFESPSGGFTNYNVNWYGQHVQGPTLPIAQ